MVMIGSGVVEWHTQVASLQGSMKKIKDFTSNNKIPRAFS